MLDEVSFYNRALDGQEMWEIYSADKDGKCPIDGNRPPTVHAGQTNPSPKQTAL